MSSFSLFLFAFTALAVVVALMPLAVRLAPRLGFMDEPGGRKRHEDATPPIGGLVVFPVFIILCMIAAPSPWFFAALALLVVTGALDDRFGVAPRIKFMIQFIAAFLIVVPGGAQAQTLGNLFGTGEFWFGDISGAIFSVIAAVLLINAINLMDGLDGLSGGIALNTILWMAVCVAVAGHYAALPLLLILAGALIGFLFYNMRRPGRSRALVFIGDAGSLALGLALAWFAMTLSQPPLNAIEPVTVAWLLALPIYDTCGQFARRVSLGRHPFDADHHHFHHHFIFAGYNPGQATARILAIAFGLAAVGVGGAALGVPDYILGYSWVALLLAHIYMSMRPNRYRRILTRLRGAA